MNIYIINIFLLTILNTESYNIPFSKSNLDRRKIHKFKILEKDIAVWWNNNKWCATDSICKHRQGDLSKGVITPSGELKCGYHGWEYNDCGDCVKIPSCSMKNKPKININNYDVVDSFDMLWLKNEDNFIDDLNEKHIRTMWFVDDVDLPYKLLLENGIDSLHFDHVHSNTPPPVNRYNPQKRYDNPVVNLNWYNETGFSCNVNTIEYKFIAPYSIIVDFENQFKIYAEAIPIDDNKTKFISTSLFPIKNKFAEIVTKILFLFLRPITKILGNKILQQDLNQISGQYENIKKYGYSHTKLSNADDTIYYFNNWLNEYGNNSLI